MEAIRKSDGKIINVEVHGWEGDCAISYHTNFKDFYKPEDLDFNVPQESEQLSSFDWKSFRAEAAKDILCALIHKTDNFIGKDSAGYAIMIADELINQLKEKEEK